MDGGKKQKGRGMGAKGKDPGASTATVRFPSHECRWVVYRRVKSEWQLSGNLPSVPGLNCDMNRKIV